ncbi:MAG: 3-isopropylmalate dehydrogenase [Armatimonadota bacterium]
MHKIAVLPCDGVGPEVVREGLKVLNAVADRCGFKYDTVEYDVGAERYLRTGETLPDSVFEELKAFDAIYLGAVGDDRVPPGILEHGILLRIRFGFDQYVNLRPVKLYPGVKTPLADKGPDDIDFLVVRENTEGLYSGAGGSMHRNTPDEVAIQTAIYTRKGTERIIRYAFEAARKRPLKPGQERHKVHLCDKANVLTHGHDLYRRVFREVAQQYPDVEIDYAFVDAVTMWMVKNPEWFDVIVTTNMFGDIITDLGAMIQGGLGVAAGGNINPDGVSMFEPIHGSAPRHAGKGVICPIASILSVAMMLDTLGEEPAARMIDDAVTKALASGRLGDLSSRSGVSTEQQGDIVLEYLDEA